MTTSFRAGFLALVLAAFAATACGGSDSESDPSAADGGLPVYVAQAPEDVHPLVYAEALHEVLDLPDEAEAYRWGDDEARITTDGPGDGYRANFRDRRAGPVQVGYSGPRYSDTECVDCVPLTDDDDLGTAIERSRDIIEGFGIDTTDFEFDELMRTDVELALTATPTVAGVAIGELDFVFFWAHDQELVRMTGSIYEIEAYDTVEALDEAEARVQAESMIGSERSITDLSLSYVGTFNADNEFVLGPAYIATTDLGTDISVSAFVGTLPDP